MTETAAEKPRKPKKPKKPIPKIHIDTDRAHLRQLKVDLGAAARTLKPHEARFLVDYYYQVQDYRTRSANYARSTMKEEGAEPNALVCWTYWEFEQIEKLIKEAMGEYALAHEAGVWSMSHFGVGEVISAGLLAHIDIARCETASRIYRFAGLDPSLSWIGREGAKALLKKVLLECDTLEAAIPRLALEVKRSPEQLRAQAQQIDEETGEVKPMTKSSVEAALARRPWNARLKVLCWKMGDCFKKFHKSDECFYGKLYEQRKAREEARNLAGDYKEVARLSLEEKSFREDTNAKKAYKQGLLPAGRLDLRAMRFAVKIFLSHWHEVAYFSLHRKLPPAPYVFAKAKPGEPHGNYIPPPHAELVPGLKEALHARGNPGAGR